MSSGDSIMITAKVIACVEEMDCAPVKFYNKLLLGCYGYKIFISKPCIKYYYKNSLHYRLGVIKTKTPDMGNERKDLCLRTAPFF